MNVMVFDIETVPDVEGGRRVFDLQGLDDAQTADAMQHLRVQKTGNDFLSHPFHRIVAISIVFRHRESLKVWSLGELSCDEPELVQRFFDGITKYTPTLVSWNGSGFDLPVLHYRALRHGIAAPAYWEQGDEQRDFRYNNYLGRFHWRHIDLMDVLAAYQMRAAAPLDQIATLLGFPGKMGMSGAHVWDAYKAGDLLGIRQYCETDVLNTYLVFLRFELMRGKLSAQAYAQECQLVRETLDRSGMAHLEAFSKAWQALSLGD